MLSRYGAAAAHGGGVRRAAARTRWASSPASSTTPTCELVGVEAAGEGIASGHHSATLSAGAPGVLHGSLSYLLQDADGQVAPAHSVSAGLDYPGVGPEHSWLRDTGRVRYESATDAEALDAFQARVPARGDHSRARDRARVRLGAPHGAGAGRPDAPVLVCLSGRGDKDVAHVARAARGARVTERPGADRHPPRLPGHRAHQRPGEGAPRLSHVPAQQSDLPARRARTCGSRSSRSGRCSTSWCSRWRRPTSSGRSRWSTTSSTRRRASPGGCSRTACARSRSAAAPRSEELPRFLETINRARFLPDGRGRRPADAALGAGVRVHPVPVHRVLRRRRRRLPEQTGTYTSGRRRRRGGGARSARRGRRGGAAPAQGRRRPRGVRLDALLPRGERDQPGRRGGRGRVPPRRPRGARSTSCSTSSSSRPSRRSGTRSSASLETLFPNLLNARDFRTAATVLRECRAARRSARQGLHAGAARRGCDGVRRPS